MHQRTSRGGIDVVALHLRCLRKERTQLSPSYWQFDAVYAITALICPRCMMDTLNAPSPNPPDSRTTGNGKALLEI